MGKIISIGETTYDIMFRNGNPTGAVVGGSVLNTAVTLSRLGLPVTFVSRMGNDHVGDLSIKFLKENNVNCDNIVRFEGNSRLALAFIGEENNAEYQFYKGNTPPSLRFPELANNDIITFGSTNAIRDEGRNSLLLFLNQAHDKNVLTIYDPNIREADPFKMADVRKKVEENFLLSKIVKGSTVDFYRLYNTTNPDVIFRKVSQSGVEALIVTAGAEATALRTHNISASFPSKKVEPVSTIGAGDNFTAGIIAGLMKRSVSTSALADINLDTWEQIISLANTLASEVCKSEYNYISKEFAEKISKSM
ncbi:MAG: carbohydrate kinase [Prolixibacteraceae bacterium]|nr:carbohydrate kinase [Prolixibacteraceae bacterium]